MKTYKVVFKNQESNLVVNGKRARLETKDIFTEVLELTYEEIKLYWLENSKADNLNLDTVFVSKGYSSEKTTPDAAERLLDASKIYSINLDSSHLAFRISQENNEKLAQEINSMSLD